MIADFGGVRAGFCGLTVRCREPGTLWVFMDEMLTSGIVDPVRRTRYATALACELKEPGEYRIEAFEATALGVAHAVMTSGAAEVGGFYVREYVNPDVRAAAFRCSDPALERIFAAAQETCAQNTMDAQMDCPSRERMSCPCDGYYTLAGCNLLAGHHAVERLFFDCFRLSTNYCSHVPGRLPGMYPNSSADGGTACIPNWNMFMALQLERYVRETGDRRSAEALRERMLETMETLKRSRNAEGLVENVPGWVFVSWDRANGSTKGVNYPTNMLWVEALDAVARLYGVREYAEEAARVRTAVRARSWNGAWFRDSSADGVTTESCQAYAFRFGLATPASHPALWRTFVEELGPCRAKGVLPSVPPSETFIGGILRLECLMAAGEHRAVLRDVKGYFQRMAETTGTLWEGLDPYAHNTLSHGFNSFVAVCLAESALGVKSVDGVRKSVELRAPDNGLEACSGSFPTVDGPIVYGWRRADGKLEEEVRLPPGWTRKTTHERDCKEQRKERHAMTNAILRGKPDAGNPHVRFDEGEVASAKPGRGSLLYKDMNRRGFIGAVSILGCSLGVGGLWAAPDKAVKTPRTVGGTWSGWQPGHFQLHSIYTGVCESMFLIYPDGTSMLLDCGDHPAVNRGALAVPVLPNGGRHAGEWIARYVKRVNPFEDKVDYLVLSHFHSDHSGIGNWSAGAFKEGRHEYALSGFAQAAQWLKFKKAVDRGWPNYNDPLPLTTFEEQESAEIMKRLYAHLTERDGLALEKFRLGARDQFAPCKDRVGGFSVLNICGNGKIVQPDGSVRDVYRNRIERDHVKTLNENGLSLGLLFNYGRFGLLTTGDFSDCWQEPDGQWHHTEDDLADAVPRVSVAKINHHGHHSTTTRLAAALRPRVWFSNVWDQLHDTADTMERIFGAYPGEKAVYAGIMPAERRWEDIGKPWTGIVAKESNRGIHVVFDVPPGGETFEVFCLSAEDEKMRIVGQERYES